MVSYSTGFLLQIELICAIIICGIARYIAEIIKGK